MAAKTLLLKLTKYVDSDGQVEWVNMRPDVAALLAETEPGLKERLLRTPENIGKVADRRGGNPWDGPRFRFRWLVGESRTWDARVRLWLDGLLEVCPVCQGDELPAYAYCLCCDRSGVDKVIEKPEEAPKDVVIAEEDGLKGGLKGKR